MCKESPLAGSSAQTRLQLQPLLGPPVLLCCSCRSAAPQAFLDFSSIFATFFLWKRMAWLGLRLGLGLGLG